MRKTIRMLITFTIIAMLFSCSPNPGSSAGGELMKDFQPETFIAEGLTAYLSGRNVTRLTFSDSFSESTAKAVSRAAGTGILKVNAIYNEYSYGNFIVSGTFVYELPVEGGVIQGYRVNSDSENTPTITDTTVETATPTSFIVKMGSSSLAPAYGTISTSGTSVTSKSGTAAAILPGTDAVFTVGNDSVDVDDIPTEPYTKDQMPADYLEIAKANTPLTLLINAKMKETGATSMDLGNGNTVSMEIIDESTQSSKTEISITSPMHFNVSLNGRTYAVHTQGSLKATATSYGTQVSASMEFKDFSSSIILENSAGTIQTKKISGTYGATMTGISANLTIGNHKYNSADFQEIMALNMLNTTLFMWGYSEIDAEGNYANYLGAEPETTPINVTGKFDATTNILEGTLNYLGAYPFTAKISISGSGQSASAIIESLTFNGYTYSDSALKNFRDVQNLMNTLISEMVG